MNDRYDVVISDSTHPHFGDCAILEGDADGNVQMIRVLGKPMIKLTLRHCAHGQDACYATKEQIRLGGTVPARAPRRAQ